MTQSYTITRQPDWHIVTSRSEDANNHLVSVLQYLCATRDIAMQRAVSLIYDEIPTISDPCVRKELLLAIQKHDYENAMGIWQEWQDLTTIEIWESDSIDEYMADKSNETVSAEILADIPNQLAALEESVNEAVNEAAKQQELEDELWRQEQAADGVTIEVLDSELIEPITPDTPENFPLESKPPVKQSTVLPVDELNS